MELQLYKQVDKRELPIEIYAIFEACIFLNDHATSFEVDQIYCALYGNVFIENGEDKGLEISYKEFLELYKGVINKKADRSVNAKELGDEWVKKNYYFRYGLAIDKSNDYLEFVMTPWNFSVYSTDHKYGALYSYESGDLSIERNGTASTDITIVEDGYLYGAWNDNGEFWTLGEFSGNTVYTYSDSRIWVGEKISDDAKLPEPLKRLKATIE